MWWQQRPDAGRYTSAESLGAPVVKELTDVILILAFFKS